MPGKIFRKFVLSVIEIVLTRMGRERRGQAEVLEIKLIISKVRNFLSKKKIDYNHSKRVIWIDLMYLKIHIYISKGQRNNESFRERIKSSPDISQEISHPTMRRITE